MKEVLPNAIFSMAETAANIVGSEPKITISEHSVDIEYVEPENTENRVWEDHYQRGAIYLKGKANPIRINIEESKEELELVSTDYYKSFMQQSTIKDALTAGGVDKPMLVKLQMATIGAILIMAFIMKV